MVEIVDEDGRPVPPGRPGAKVLLTNLINYAQPLIRYELTDSVVESRSQSRGPPWRCLVSVDGRTADILYLRAEMARRSRSILPYSGRLSRPSPRLASIPSCTTRRGYMLRWFWPRKPPLTSPNDCGSR